MKNSIKSIVRAFLTFSLIIGFVLEVTLVSAQLIVVIDSDTTWTKADSPHTLTGPLLIEQGVTLTIEAGASVDLNGYEIRVNGTLRAVGLINDQIHFNNGKITFTEYSNGWNEQTGSGSIMEFYSLEEVTLSSNGHAKLNNYLVIQSDCTWTNANGAYNLLGAMAIESGSALTIEAGVTFNLNGNTLVVKGELVAVGATDDQIHFENGTILFEKSSIGWNEETGSGSRIENVVCSDVALASSVPLKVNNVVMEESTLSVTSMTLLNSKIDGLTRASGNSILQNNVLGELLIMQGSVVVSNNTIGNMDCEGGSPVITNNEIYGIGSLVLSEEDIEIDYFVADSPVISNNQVTGGMYLDCNSAVVTNNVVYPRTYSISWTWWERLYIMHTEHRSQKTSGISIKGGAEVTGNTIYDCKVGIEGLSTVRGNTIYDCEVGVEGASTIEGNVFIGNDHGVNVNSETTIQNNLFESNKVGVYVVNSPLVTIRENRFTSNEEAINGGGNMIIENNELVSNQIAVKFRELVVDATIRNNAFTDNTEGLRIQTQPLSLDFTNNNIVNCSQNSIYLEDVTIDIDAKNNWWGTTDSEAIGLKIYDSKYSFDIGTVTFSPFLTEPNPQAALTLAPPEPSIPYEEIAEYPAWLVLPIFLVTTVAVVSARKKLVQGANTK